MLALLHKNFGELIPYPLKLPDSIFIQFWELFGGFLDMNFCTPSFICMITTEWLVGE
jgi:hypothetical protein